MSNGRAYITEFENVAVAAAQDLFEIVPADDKPCKIGYIILTQNTELGDAQEEQLRLRIIRGHTTVGSGGGTDNESPIDPNDAAAGYVGGINNTTIASVGSVVNLHSENWNIRVPFIYMPPPEFRLKVTQAEISMVLRLLAAPGDSVTMSGVMCVLEG